MQKTVMYKFYKQPAIILLLFFILGGSVIVFAMRGSFFEKKQQQRPAKTGHILKSDKAFLNEALLEKFQHAIQSIDTEKEECLLAGFVTSINRADSTESFINEPYTFTKKGEEFYYKIGAVETINAKGLCLHVDHQGKKIIVSEQKKIEGSQAIFDSQNLWKDIKEEGYSLSSSMIKGVETITLRNDEHLSCREYSISYDTLSLKVNRVSARISNPEYSEQKDKDKTIEIRLNRLESQSDQERLNPQNYIEKVAGEWAPLRKYHDYELIVM